jgi:Tfp pilus assembly protein PilN
MISFKTSIGIELRGEDMLISSLQSNLSSPVFTCFKRIANYQALDREDLRREVGQFFRSNGLSKEHVVLGIPRKDIVLRYLDLPSEVIDNLKQVIQYQVQSFEPTEEDKFYYDYLSLKNDAALKKLTILLAMVKKTLLDEHIQLMREFGIRPEVVIASSMGLANIFLQNRNDVNDKTFILADLGSSGIELLALRNGAFAYSRETGKESDQSWKDLVLREVDEAASKLRLGPDGTLEKIVLSGESSESALEEIKAGIPECELLKDSVGFTIPEENKAYFQEAASTLGLAFTGMMRRAPIRMNLLPKELRIRHSIWAYVPAAIFGLACIALLSGLLSHRTYQLRAYANDLDREFNNNKSMVQQVQSLTAQEKTMATKIESIELIVGKRDMNLEVLRELTNILPLDTYLSNYANRDGSIQMIGMGNSASDLIRKLEDSPFLKDVVTSGVIIKDAQSGKERFTINAKLER